MNELQEKAAGMIDMMLAAKLDSPIGSTPANLGIPFEEVSFPTDDGIMLKGWLLRGGTNKVAIQSHFVTANRSGTPEGVGLSKTAKAFHDDGYTVLMFDARNHGQSDLGPVPYALGTQQDSPDFVAAVDFVTGLSGYENASIGVTGMCFGASALPGAFALENGLSCRENVKAITIIQPGTWGMLMRGALGDETVDEINRQLDDKGSDGMDVDSLPHASAINVPTMLMHNQNDPMGDLDYTRRYFDEIQTQKNLHWIDGPADRAYAYTHITQHPEILINWFNSHLDN